MFWPQNSEACDHHKLKLQSHHIHTPDSSGSVHASCQQVMFWHHTNCCYRVIHICCFPFIHVLTMRNLVIHKEHSLNGYKQMLTNKSCHVGQWNEFWSHHQFLWCIAPPAGQKPQLSLFWCLAIGPQSVVNLKIIVNNLLTKVIDEGVLSTVKTKPKTNWQHVSVN